MDFGIIQGCFVHHNGAQGIRVNDHCTITGNSVQDNVSNSAGIWLRGASNRVEDNHCDANGFGIWTVSTDNFIAKNACRGNVSANFSVGAGNEMAPVITNPGSNGFATMTPWSNVSY